MILLSIILGICLFLFIVAEVCCHNGMHKSAQLFRVIVETGTACTIVAQDTWTDSYVFILVGSAILWVAATYRYISNSFGVPRVWASHISVPRLVLYVEQPDGKCIAVTDAEAKKAASEGKVVYINAMARVQYKPNQKGESK